MQTKLISFILFSLAIITPLFVHGQIKAPEADYSASAEYDTVGVDSLFVFNVGNNNAYIEVDTDSFPTSEYDIQWEEYVVGSGFQVMADTNSRINILASPATQGYRLTLTSVDTTIRVIRWVIWNGNNTSMRILSKDENGDITKDALTSSDCIRIGYIEVEYIQDQLIYYSAYDNSELILELEHESEFEMDPVPADGFGTMKETDGLNDLLRYTINNSHYEDVEYTIIVTDEAGLSRQDKLNVTAIRPWAEWLGSEEEMPELIPLDDKEYYPDRDTLYYRAYGGDYNDNNKSAPALFKFELDIYNVDSIKWNMGDSTYFTTTNPDTVYQYFHYGSYNTSAEVVNYFDFRRECYYTIESRPIEIDKPQLGGGGESSGSGTEGEGGASSEGAGQVQNVFTPPNGSIPIWRFDDVSIIDCEIAIYNRIGTRVHYFKGNIRDWGGWDGTVNNSSRYASTGVYFYVLKEVVPVTPFDVTEEPVNWGKKDEIRRGFIHLFRTD